MSEHHLDYRAVQRLISFVKEQQPIIIGGQSIAIYAAMFESISPWLQKKGRFTSKDLDFLENPAAEKALAEKLADSHVERPTPDDHTPEAAKISGQVEGQEVEVDFMRFVKGVDIGKAKARAVMVQDPDQPGSPLFLLHPVDCVRSRLANTNLLGRTDAHALDQAEASVVILNLFLQQELDDASGGPQRVTKVAQELEYVLRDMHYGKPTHMEFGDRLPILEILEGLVDDVRLDLRWREKTLAGIIERCRTKRDVELARKRPTP